MRRYSKLLWMATMIWGSVMCLSACGGTAQNHVAVETTEETVTGKQDGSVGDGLTAESGNEEMGMEETESEEAAGQAQTPKPYVDKLDRTDEGLILVWNDEFEGDALDTAKWDYQYGNGGEYGNPGWGNSEVQYYLNREENVRVEDGRLIITAWKEDTPMPYTSARIRTITNRGETLFATTYGRVEARIKMPVGEGIWPAFWMLPVDTSIYGAWAASGEIDIMEAKGRLPKQIGGACHFGKVWPNNTYKNQDYFFPEGTDITDYHLYSIEWEPDEIRWYVDNECYFTLTDWFSQGKAPGTAYAEPAPFDVPFYIILNMAVGGTFDPEADLDNTEFPVEMEVDFVRVYQKEEGYDTSSLRTETPELKKEISYSTNGIFNGAFDQGNDRLAYWTVEGMEVTVPDYVVQEDGAADYSRKAQLVAMSENAGLSQAGIPLEGDKEYVLSLELTADESVKVGVTLTGSDNTVYVDESYGYTGTETETAEYTFAVPQQVTDEDALFKLTLRSGDCVKVDNVRLVVKQ